MSAENPAYRGRVAAVVLGLVILCSGCSLSPVEVVLRVEPAALDDIRGIGEVRAESTSESEKDGSRQISHALIIDVGAASGREALDKAAGLLLSRRWKISAENRPTIVSMESSRWEDTRLILRPFHPAYFEDQPEVIEQLEESSAEVESLVHADVEKGVL
ncbi:hypothetical protein [Nonomuraea coxensis]|uniref:hypothetical protein n=1 Tax=Nonomuraea coxensis TaxID=404386 RepID=UPI000361D025|nr:hypothetical protein [Nonomuraea coxensis]